MKKQIPFLGLLSVLAISVLPSSASAFVTAMPSYYDFGSVEAGQSVETRIVFVNNSSLPVQFFNAHCSGDYAAFSCFSMCSYLPPFGSCFVQVRFSPRNGDGQRRMLWVNGTGAGSFASSTVYGTDEKAPDPAPSPTPKPPAALTPPSAN